MTVQRYSTFRFEKYFSDLKITIKIDILKDNLINQNNQYNAHHPSISDKIFLNSSCYENVLVPSE